MFQHAIYENAIDSANHGPGPGLPQLALDRAEVLLQTLQLTRLQILQQIVGLAVELPVLQVWDVSDVEAEAGLKKTKHSR